MNCINFTNLILSFLIVVVFSSCGYSDNSKEQKAVLEKENDLLKKENELLKKEQDLNKKAIDTTQNLLPVQTKSENTKQNSLEELKYLNGKYSFETRLFDNVTFNQRLKKLIGNRYDFLKEYWNVATPMEFSNNTFVAEACKAHFCNSTNFIIVYNFSNDVMWAGIRDNNNVKIYSDDGTETPSISEWAKKNSNENLETEKSSNSSSSKFYLGDEINPNQQNFKILGISSETNVSTYKYIGKINEEYFYGRKIDDIIVGVKHRKVVTTIYNLIPENDEVGVPNEIIELIQKTLPAPLAYKNGIWGINIDNESISISRTKNAMTFYKDRIMVLNSIKQSLLRQ